MDFESLGTLSICSSSLEYLKISGNVDIEFTIIELDVPKLKIFVYDDNLAENYVIKSSMSLLEEAYLDVQHDFMCCGEPKKEEHCQNVAKLVEACSNARTLFLSGYIIKVIRCVSTPLRAFSRLTQVTLGKMNIDGNFWHACLKERPTSRGFLWRDFMSVKMASTSLLPPCMLCLRVCVQL